MYTKTSVMNTENNAVTEYSNFGFNSFCVFNGKYLGAKSDGIFELTGDTDYASPSPALVNGTFTLPTIDAGKGQPRKPRDAWIAGRKGEIQLSVAVDEKTTYNYSSEIIDPDIHEERIKIGRGIRGRFFSFIITNVDGSRFNISIMRVLVELLKKAR
ncbi:hypothetical protein KAR91_42200 [Candidatus Pacearchaeota archaeon]|nr:hypothetical protein [Candidatus Pacearchaeota archaeon]